MRAVLVLLALCAPVRAAIPVVAAENVYGDVAGQIGGDAVTVTSILQSPDQDPHLFEASASVARAVASARIVVLNGAGYDPWMDKLLRAARGKDRRAIVAGEVAGRPAGANPHIWYDPRVMGAVAAALADALAEVDPAHADGFRQRLAAFGASLDPIEARIAALAPRTAGVPVTATEPVFGEMFSRLGMASRNTGFQLAVMNDTEPTASQVAAFERDLRGGAVKLLVFNSQAKDAIAERMERLAHASGVPVIGVTETEPPGTIYQAWIAGTLDAVARALP